MRCICAGGAESRVAPCCGTLFNRKQFWPNSLYYFVVFKGCLIFWEFHSTITNTIVHNYNSHFALFAEVRFQDTMRRAKIRQ